MHVQPRHPAESFLICAPVTCGAGEDNFGAALGRQIARGLHAGDLSDTNNADRVRYMEASGAAWKELALVTNAGAGAGYWYDGDTATTADVAVTAGMAFWVQRGTGTVNRADTVFAGRSHTGGTVTDMLFRASAGGWTPFGWPLARSKRHRNTEASGKYSTPTNQLGFAAAGTGGKTSDPLRPGELGDQIWVWSDNGWRDFYWLVGHVGTNWDGRWWDDHAHDFADFRLDPGVGYYYRHTTNWGGTNFLWRPAN
jgi:hypothetical protein